MLRKNFLAVMFAGFAVALSGQAATVSGKISLKAPDGEAIGDASNVVVYLRGEGVDGKPMTPVTNASIASRGKVFVPEVLAVPMGSTVSFPNDDIILHNVFSLSTSKVFDLGLYGKSETKATTFEKAGIVRVFCNIHKKMAAYIAVMENPYFTLTDSEGKFEIPNVPGGKLTIGVWHRFGGSMEKPLTVAAGNSERTSIEFSLQEVTRVLSHKTKYGAEYPDKY